MEKKDKIIIIGLIIVIIALSIGIASMFIGNNGSNDTNVPQGMHMHDFNSEFKMAVPNNVHFLKEWNKTGEYNFAQTYSYFDKNNEFAVSYIDSPLITHEFINNMIEMGNKTVNSTVKYEGDLIIIHNLDSNGKIVDSENSNFTDAIILQKDHIVVGVSGNDLDFLKSMANTIQFYE